MFAQSLRIRFGGATLIELLTAGSTARNALDCDRSAVLALTNRRSRFSSSCISSSSGKALGLDQCSSCCRFLFTHGSKFGFMCCRSGGGSLSSSSDLRSDSGFSSGRLRSRGLRCGGLRSHSSRSSFLRSLLLPSCSQRSHTSTRSSSALQILNSQGGCVLLCGGP